MADREARIRLQLQSGSFVGGLRQMGDVARSTGLQIGKYLQGPASAGLQAFRSSASQAVGQLKGLAATAAGLAGGFSVGMAAKDALHLQGEYRNLANQVNRLVDHGMDWVGVQEMIESTSRKAGQAPEKMIAAFRDVFTATGDLEYSRKAIEAIGVASTGSGEAAEKLATPMQLAARKFGIGADGIEDAMARIIEKVGVGGLSLDDMNARFGAMAGEASEAGMRGAQGLSSLLGIMLQLDSRVGEKSSMGLRTMFQYLKDNTTQIKALEKASGVKFEVDTTAFEKLRKLIGSSKGRAAAELTFTSDSRVVYDELVKPFEAAFKQAKESGASTAEATTKAYEAYDEAMAKMTASNANYAKLQEQAAERLKNDPAVMMERAMLDLKLAFTKPEMIGSMQELARVMPHVVGGMTKLVNFVVQNPLISAAGFVGGKAAASGLATFSGELLAKTAKDGFKGLGGMIAAEAATNGKWAAAGKTIGVAAAGVISFEVGKSVANWVADMIEAQQQEAEKADLQQTNKLSEVLSRADSERSATGTVAPATRKALESHRELLKGKLEDTERAPIPTPVGMYGMMGPQIRSEGSVQGRNEAHLKANAQLLEAVERRLSGELKVRVVNAGSSGGAGGNGLPPKASGDPGHAGGR